MHYDYRFERVDVRKGAKAYEDQVHAAADEGWRLVQMLVEQPAAIASAYVLIIERTRTS